MKKILRTILLSIISLSILTSCFACTSLTDKEILIPEKDIIYTDFDLGNVIFEEKRAVFLNFSSTYTVTKLEVAGSLLDVNGEVIENFDTTMSFGTPSNKPDLSISIDDNLVKKVRSVHFTKIKAYTKDKIN